jgi:hypothetical protein
MALRESDDFTSGSVDAGGASWSSQQLAQGRASRAQAHTPGSCDGPSQTTPVVSTWRNGSARARSSRPGTSGWYESPSSTNSEPVEGRSASAKARAAARLASASASSRSLRPGFLLTLIECRIHLGRPTRYRHVCAVHWHRAQNLRVVGSRINLRRSSSPASPSCRNPASAPVRPGCRRSCRSPAHPRSHPVRPRWTTIQWSV